MKGVLFARSVDRYIFTDRGFIWCEDDEPRHWTRLLPDSGDTTPRLSEAGFAGEETLLPTVATYVGGTSVRGPTYRIEWLGERIGFAPAEPPPDAPGAAPAALFPRELIGVEAGFWSSDSSAAGAVSGQAWWAAALRGPLFGRDAGDTLLLPLPGMRSLVSCAATSRWEFQRSAPPSPALFAATDGRLVLMLPPPMPAGWERWAIPVPVRLSIRRSGGRAEAWDFRSNLPPRVLPHDALEVATRFARDYADWWETATRRIRGRARVEGGGDAPPWSTADDEGVVRLPVDAGKSYVLEFESAEANGAKFTGIRTLPLAVEAAPAPPQPRVLAALAALALGATLLLVFSRIARQAVVRALGRRWTLSAPEREVVVEARGLDGGGIEWTAGRSGAVTVRRTRPRAALAESDGAEVRAMREALLPALDTGVQTISLRTSEALFHDRLAHWLTGGWATAGADARRIAGQTALLARVLDSSPRRIRRLRFASVAFRGDPPLSLEAEIPLIEATFRKMRADIRPRGSRPSDLLSALCEADVVHVAAHATLTEIQLEGGAFSAMLNVR